MKVSVFCITDSRNYGDFLQTFLTAKLIEEELDAEVNIRGRALMYYAIATLSVEDIEFRRPPRFTFFSGKEHLSAVAGHTTGYGNYHASMTTYTKALKMAKRSAIFPLSVSRIDLFRMGNSLWKVMSGFDVIYTRGLESYFLLESVGLGNIDVALDTGFALRKVYPDVKSKKEGEKLKVAIVPRKDFFYAYEWYNQYARYLKTLREVAGLLKERYDAEITLVPFSFGYETSDVHAVEDLIRLAKFEDNTLQTFRYPVGEGYKKLSEFDLVITSRMHAGIMAMSAGIPAIIVLPRAEQKSVEVLNYLGLDERQHFENMFRLNGLLLKVEDMVENISKRKKVVDRAVERRINDVMKPVESIRKIWEV